VLVVDHYSKESPAISFPNLPNAKVTATTIKPTFITTEQVD